jgi:hypothetical protein
MIDKYLKYSRFKVYSFIIFFIALVVLYISAYSTVFHSDEALSFSEAFYYSSGLYPHLDFFSHRLPLSTVIYGEWLALTNKTLESGRILSVILSSCALSINAYVVMRVTDSAFIGLLSVLIFSNALVLYLLSAFSIYPIVIFLFSCACLSLLSENYLRGRALFLFFNSLIWMSRYLIDPQVVILVVFYFIFLYQDKSNKNRILYTLSAFIFPLLFISIGGDQLFYATFTFNLEQIEHMKIGFNPDVSSFIDRFIHVRKEEVREYFPILLLSITTMFFLTTKINLILKKSIFENKSNYLLVLYSILFVFGYYFFIMLSAWDWPITKIYFLPALAFLVMFTLFSLLKELPKKNRNFIIFIMLAPLILWPFIQNHKFYSRADSAINLYEIFDSEILKDLERDGEYLTFIPLVLQNNINIDKSLAMEMYSFLHDFNEEDAHHHHLASGQTIIDKINNGDYLGLILNSRYYNKTGMSIQVNDFREEIDNAILYNYQLIKKYNQKTFGEIYIYQLKEK